MKAHLVQLDIVWEDKAANRNRVKQLIEQTDLAVGDLIVLPELFDVGFTLNTSIAHDDGTTLAFLQSLADETACTVHGARALLPSDQRLAYNCATICQPGNAEPVCEYQKIHPFSFGRESESYTGGSTLGKYDWNAMHVCPVICYDLRFPELFRLGSKQGAEVFVYGANWPSPRQSHWRTLSIARAIENQAFVIAVNRCGNDPHLPYSGGSIVIDPKGEIIGELGDNEAVLSVEIDPGVARDWRTTFPALRDIKLI